MKENSSLRAADKLNYACMLIAQIFGISENFR